MIDFRMIQGGKPSKPANFEDMCSQLILAKFPRAKPVEGKGGDAGCDLFHGSEGLADWHDLRIFQYKYFCDTLTSSQKRQIEVSLRKAIEHWHPWSWVLCMPKNLTPAEHTWFKALEERYCDYKKARETPREALCFMNHWGESQLRSLLAEFPHIRSQFFPLRFTLEQESQIRDIVTEVVAELPQDLAFISRIESVAERLERDPVSIEYDVLDWVRTPRNPVDHVLARMLRLDYAGAEKELENWRPREEKDEALKRLLRGNCHFAFKRYREAIEAYTVCLEFPHFEVNAYNNRGVSCRREGLLSEALSDFGEVIARQPNLAEGYANRAVVRKVQGDYEPARADLDKAISLRSDFFEAYFNRAIIHARLGDFTAAMQDFGKAEPILQKLHWTEWLRAGNSDFAAASLSTLLDVYAHGSSRELDPYVGHRRSHSLGMLRNVCPEDISRLRWFVDQFAEPRDDGSFPF